MYKKFVSIKVNDYFVKLVLKYLWLRLNYVTKLCLLIRSKDC